MEIVELPVNKIVPSVFQPRETFAKEELDELAESMKEFGLLQPIMVKENTDSTYQIIAGERRWRAAQFAGMKKIYAFIKDVTAEQQRVESLIENIHRKDLDMLEKGRGLIEIFKIYGIDEKPRQLSKTLHVIRTRQEREMPIEGTNKKINEIASKLHKPTRTMETWLDAIAVEPEIIKEHQKTPKKDRIPDSALARISTIENKNLQKQTYSKIKKQDMSDKQASSFVTGIKKLAKKKPKVAKMVLESDLPIDIAEEIPEEQVIIDIPEEDLKEMVQKIDEGKKRTSEIKDQPIVQERIAHNENHSKHLVFLTLSEKAFCPFCGKDGKHLRWICHPEKTLPEALEQASVNFTEATTREDIDKRFENAIGRVIKNK
ncbi:Nucleoid occlusion protein [subsurface metagenome]|jgi:ParB family chromosome partitioning protein